MKFLVAASIAASTVLFATGTANAATTITFAPLDGQDFVPVSYTEAGYTIQSNTTFNDNNRVLNRTLGVQNSIAPDDNSFPSVNFFQSSSFDLTGGTFTFQGLNAFFSGMSLRPISITGSLLGVQTYSGSLGRVTANDANPFPFFSSGTGNSIFDRLVFVNENNSGLVVLDNIQVTAVVPQVSAVPEPATWAMVIVGFGLVGGTLRRRNVVANVRLA